MSAISEYFDAGGTILDLQERLAIRVANHPALPLAILNYDQIESPRFEPVARDCRGLVVDTETHKIVAKTFTRFFNFGEHAEETQRFDWKNSWATSKEDGSLVTIFCYKGQWMATTRGSFGFSTVNDSNLTWQQLVRAAIGGLALQNFGDVYLTRSEVYACELCSPHNKIVRSYESPRMYLLGKFSKSGQEMDLVHRSPFSEPKETRFHSIDDIRGSLDATSLEDPTFEGYVLRDCNGIRIKVKSPTYLSLHRMGSNGTLDHHRNLLPHVWTNNLDEVLTYFPECESAARKLQCTVAESRGTLLGIWLGTHHLTSQKEFAQRIVGSHPLSSVLFTLRKTNPESVSMSWDQVRNLFHETWNREWVRDLYLKHLER